MHDSQKEFSHSPKRPLRGLALSTNGSSGYVTLEVYVGGVWVSSGDDPLEEDGYYEIPQYQLRIRITPYNGATYEYS